MDALEFPISLPNQPLVETYSRYVSVFEAVTSIIIGLATKSVPNVFIALGVQFVLLLILLLPNWPFLTPKKDVEWLKVSY